jgi:hypothetical protein
MQLARRAPKKVCARLARRAEPRGPLNSFVSQHLKSSRLRLALLAILGASTPLWWNWCLGFLSRPIWLLFGSPELPSLALAWTSLSVPPLLVGAAAGAAIVAVMLPRPSVGWWVLVVTSVVARLLVDVSRGFLSDCPAILSELVGTSTFILGSLAIFAFSRVRHSAG